MSFIDMFTPGFTVASDSDELRNFVVGPIQTNCYAYISGAEAIVFDPGFAGDKLADALADVSVVGIVCTHGHGDHVGGVAELKAKTQAPFFMNEKDVALARSMEGPGNHPGETQPPIPDHYLNAGDSLSVGSATFRVIECPGHTQGGIVLIGQGTAEGTVFVGDTLFCGSRGRTDLPGGNDAQMAVSLELLKREIQPSWNIYSGHGPATTMQVELDTNPFLR